MWHGSGGIPCQPHASTQTRTSLVLLFVKDHDVVERGACGVRSLAPQRQNLAVHRDLPDRRTNRLTILLLYALGRMRVDPRHRDRRSRVSR
jgi:hypothetical protein